MELNEVYEKLGWEELEEQLQLLYPQWNISFYEIIRLIVTGRAKEAFEQLLEEVGRNFSLEWGSWKNIIITIAVVILISAVFSAFKDAFHNQQIADIAFYINYLILIILHTRVFQYILETGEDMLIQIEQFMRLFFPAYFMALGMAAGAATGSLYYQLACLVIYGVELVLQVILLPSISGYMLFSIMNGVWEEDRLDLLLALWKKGIKNLLKLLLGMLTGAGMVQSMITPIIERIKGEGIYKAAEAIPGVGELTEGAMRIWLGSAVLIKNSVGIAGCILLAGLILVPLVKIAITGCMLKLIAALLGVVGDKRMIRFTDGTGEGIFLVLQTITYGILFFVVLVAITAYTTNGGF